MRFPATLLLLVPLFCFPGLLPSLYGQDAMGPGHGRSGHAASNVATAGGARERDEHDPCGFAFRKPGDLALWGYGRDALIVDMQRWILHPATRIDVIGSSVMQRPLYHMVFTNPASQLPKKRIWIHARTHPIESESSWVARAIVDELLGGSELGRLLLDHAVVHVLPMLNPDGVELQRARENANGVDLESNWGAASPQPEVDALRRHLSALMASEAPVEVALNLHSAWDCKRYFVYHAPAGTSPLFAQLQQRFIGFARGRFPGGIEPHDYFVSWTTGTPDRYPESWFWLNFRESVMALTYEDMNCAAAGDFDRTARALLGAAADYLGLTGITPVDAPVAPADNDLLAALYPQPVPMGGTVAVRLAGAAFGEESRERRVSLHDLLGREVALLFEGKVDDAGNVLQFSPAGLPAGTYLLRAASGTHVETRPLLILP